MRSVIQYYKIEAKFCFYFILKDANEINEEIINRMAITNEYSFTSSKKKIGRLKIIKKEYANTNRYK